MLNLRSKILFFLTRPSSRSVHPGWKTLRSLVPWRLGSSTRQKWRNFSPNLLISTSTSMRVQQYLNSNKKCICSSVPIRGNLETEENSAKVWLSMWSQDGIVLQKLSLKTISTALELTSGLRDASSLSCLVWWKTISPTLRNANHFFQVGRVTHCLQMQPKPLLRKSSSNNRMTNWARFSTSSAHRLMKFLKIL